MENKKYTIYKITCLNNKRVYIGQTVSFLCRQRDHVRLLNNNKHYNKYLQRSWNKYREENFTFEVLEECDDFNSLNEREIYWIEFYCSTSLKKGFNIQKGGQKQSRNRAVVKYSLKGEKLEEYASIKEAAKLNNCHLSQIMGGCSGESKVVKGFQWRYKSDNLQQLNITLNKEQRRLESITKATKNNCIKVTKQNLNKELIKIYSSMNEAARDNQTTASVISKCCSKNYTHKGFKYEINT